MRITEKKIETTTFCRVGGLGPRISDVVGG